MITVSLTLCFTNLTPWIWLNSGTFTSRFTKGTTGLDLLTFILHLLKQLSLDSVRLPLITGVALLNLCVALGTSVPGSSNRVGGINCTKGVFLICEGERNKPVKLSARSSNYHPLTLRISNTSLYFGGKWKWDWSQILWCHGGGSHFIYVVRDVWVTKREITEDVGLVQGCNRNMRL